MGRLADFAARDMKRKRAVIQANGGWRRPETSRGSSASGSNQAGLPGSSPQTPTMMPNFNGMVPGVKEPQLPMGFEASRDTSPQSIQSDDTDLQTRTAEAEEEWQEIRAAFTVLEDHLGEDFQALGAEYTSPIETPFGTALQYRTYGIAGIWMNYYMGLICCHRSHPSMPPATMVAAGIMRKNTEYYANQLGRIAAGIAPDCHASAEVNTSVGGALIESSTCLFISAIQVLSPPLSPPRYSPLTTPTVPRPRATDLDHPSPAAHRAANRLANSPRHRLWLRSLVGQNLRGGQRPIL